MEFTSPFTKAITYAFASTAEAPPPTYSDEANALFAAMSVEPDASRKQAYDDFYTGFLAAGFVLSEWRQYCLAAHDSQASLLELGNPGTNTLTVNSAPTFTVDSGYQGDGVDDYLGTGILANAFTPRLVCFASSDTAQRTGSAIGAATDNTLAFNSRNASDNAFLKMANATQLASANTNGGGVFVGTKTVGNTLRIQRNGTSLGTGATGADSFGADELVILRASVYTVRPVSFAAFGPFLTAANAATYSTLVHNLLDAINPGLIP